jgi:hypothetical protein
MPIAIGIHNIASRQELDQLIESANAENKRVIITLGQHGREVRVLKKENRLFELIREVTKQTKRENALVADYRNRLNIIRISGEHEGPSPRAQAQSQATQALQESIAQHSEQQVLTQPEPLAELQADAKQAPTTAPKLDELIAWYQAKTDRFPEEITPGFDAEKSGEFVALTNKKVQSEMTKDGDSYRPHRRKLEKVHLSIDRAQFESAWEQLAPKLFSSKNPFLQFKISTLVDDSMLQASKDKISARGYNPEVTAGEIQDLKRVSEGLQITFYYTPPGSLTSKEQVEEEAVESAHFLKELSDITQAFTPGTVYGRTLQLTPYIDYRDEGWARGNTHKPVQEALNEEPFDQYDQGRLARSPFFSHLEKEFKSQT